MTHEEQIDELRRRVDYLALAVATLDREPLLVKTEFRSTTQAEPIARSATWLIAYEAWMNRSRALGVMIHEGPETGGQAAIFADGCEAGLREYEASKKKEEGK